MRTREIHLAARPHGEPAESDFALAEVDLPDPEPGQVLVRNLWMSVDPYMRGRMNDVRSYVPPYQIGQPLDGGAVGEVIASPGGTPPVGTPVLHGLGWREHALVDASHARPLDPALAPLQAHLGVLGMPGLTAYAGLVEVAGLRPDDVVFVSAAAGAVGGVVVQLAKLRGHRVIASAGSAAKVAYLRDDLHADAAFDYHDGPVGDLLRDAAGGPIDVYFDNVGGDHLEAAISAMRVGGRIAVCGMVGQYNSPEPPPAPRNLAMLVGKRLRVQGFLVTDHHALRPAFEQEVGTALREGRLHARETVMDGLEHAPAAFIGMLRGANVGKMLVRL